MNNMMEMMRAFNQFKNDFRGNPKDIVMKMINSGQINQNQLNQLQETARQFQNFMGNNTFGQG